MKQKRTLVRDGLGNPRDLPHSLACRAAVLQKLIRLLLMVCISLE